MRNGFVLLAVAISLAGFAGMMRIKTDVQTLSRERARLAEEQIHLREAKRVLEAEYAHVANPLRLKRMAEKRGFEPITMMDVVPMDLTYAKPQPEGVSGATVLERAFGGNE